MDSCVYHDSHPQCSVLIDSGFHPLWDGKMSIRFHAE